MDHQFRIHEKLKSIQILEPCIPVVVFGLISVFTCWDLLQSGYILTRDMFIFHPYMNFSTEWYGLDEYSPFITRLPVLLAIDGISDLTSVETVQKTIIFSSFFIAGISMYFIAPGGIRGKLFAGILYTVNPFMYSHLIAGQWALIIAYAITPISISLFLRIIKLNRKKDILIGSLLFSTCGFFQIHWFLILPAIFISLLIPFLILNTQNNGFKFQLRIMKTLFLLTTITILINLFWLIPYIFSNHNFQYQIDHIDFYVHSFRNFYTGNILLEFIFMRGFWLEPELFGADLQPDFNWLIASVLAIFPFGLFLSKWAQKKYILWIISSVILLVISTLLAIGYANPFTKLITEKLVELFPPYAIFRDTQKWTSILIFSFCILSSITVTWLTTLSRNQKLTIRKPPLKPIMLNLLIGFLFLLPFLNTSQLFSLNTQLKPTDIPEDWNYAREYIDNNKDSSQTLIFPWQPEIPFHWVNSSQNWLGPIERTFFSAPVLKAEHHEFLNESNSPSQNLDKFIKETIYDQVETPQKIPHRLTLIGVKHVLLLHEDRYEYYRKLLSDSNLKLVVDLPTLSIFENEHYMGRAIGIDSTDVEDNSKWNPISSTNLTPVSFLIENITPTQNWVFTPPQKTDPRSWRFENDRPIAMIYNFIPVYESNKTSGALSFSPYSNLRLFGYAISLSTLILLAVSLVIINIKDYINRKTHKIKIKVSQNGK